MGHRPSQSPSKLVLVKRRSLLRKIAACIQCSVAEVIVKCAVELFAAGPRRDLNLPTALIAQLCIEIVRDHFQLGDGVQAGHDGNPHIYVFLDVAVIDAKGIRRFPLAADGERADVSIA